MTHFFGNYTEFDDKFGLTASSHAITDAVVAEDRIAIDWWDNDDSLNAVLRKSKIDGMEIWSGDIICIGSRIKRGRMSSVRYDLKQGGVVLIVTWWQDGNEGKGMYEIFVDDSVAEVG